MRNPTADEFLAQLRGRIGTEVTYHAPEEMSRASFRKYALGVGDFNPLYTDRELARSLGMRDVMAPPTLVCDTWQYMESDIDEVGDMVARGASRVPMGLRAGNDYEFIQPIHPDDVITARWTFKDAYEKKGRSGRLIFQVVEASFYNQRKELLARNTELIFYQF